MKYAVIGGSVLSQLNSDLDGDAETIQAAFIQNVVKTPYGETSSGFTHLNLNNTDVIYFNRHAHGHSVAPHLINYRANMYALKEMGVTHIIASAAVGGISANMGPLSCAIPDQLIDYTYGREQTYNELHTGSVNHIDFSYPFDETLRQQLLVSANKLGIECVSEATYGVTQGPRLETAAEIVRMQQDGCDIVGMTIMPEAGLARELEMSYAVSAIVVNWAAGKAVDPAGKPTTISMTEIVENIKQADQILQRLVINAIT